MCYFDSNKLQSADARISLNNIEIHKIVFSTDSTDTRNLTLSENNSRAKREHIKKEIRSDKAKRVIMLCAGCGIKTTTLGQRNDARTVLDNWLSGAPSDKIINGITEQSNGQIRLDRYGTIFKHISNN